MLRWIHDNEKPVYTISIAAGLLGCHPRTLRIYEQVGIISPHRSCSKYRLFSQQDLMLIKNICDLMDKWDLNLSGVKAILEMGKRFHIETEKILEEMLK